VSELKSIIDTLHKKTKFKKRRFDLLDDAENKVRWNGIGSGLFSIHEHEKWGHCVSHILTGRTLVAGFDKIEQAEKFAACCKALDGWDTEDIISLQRFRGFCGNVSTFVRGQSLVPSAVELVMNKLNGRT